MARLGRSLPMPVSACTNHNVTILVPVQGVASLTRLPGIWQSYPCKTTLNWHIEFQLPGLRLGSSAGKPRCSRLAAVCHKVEHHRYSQQI